MAVHQKYFYPAHKGQSHLDWVSIFVYTLGIAQLALKAVLPEP